MVIGKNGRDIPQSEAEKYIAGYSMSVSRCAESGSELMIALAIDMTARNVQDAVKKKGLPWSTAKGFDTFSPVG